MLNVDLHLVEVPLGMKQANMITALARHVESLGVSVINEY